jgi:hypothetical protein
VYPKDYLKHILTILAPGQPALQQHVCHDSARVSQAKGASSSSTSSRSFLAGLVIFTSMRLTLSAWLAQIIIGCFFPLAPPLPTQERQLLEL